LQTAYTTVLENIAAAARRSGRSPSDITLVAVTKALSAEKTAALLALGATHIGENRVQVLEAKREQLDLSGVNVHFIGSLQANKAKYLVGQTALIQSVDRLSLAEEISKQAQKKSVTQDILLEVNIGGEAQKGGVRKDELAALYEQVQALDGLCVKGLMAIPPFGQEEAQTREYFREMKMLFDGFSDLRVLSMGMSADYRMAIEEGATMVRVGSALTSGKV